MRDRNRAPRLEWPGGIVPEWAKPQGNPNGKRRRGGKGKHKGGGGGGHERQGGSSPSKRERLQKIMAQSGHGSRRNIEILIAQGHITINGQVAKLGDLVGPGDKVKMDDEFIQLRFGEPLPRVLLYHKPEGEIVTRDDPEGRATVFEKLPRVHNGRWVSIGRLDLNTGGLLIFTTSGELANRLMHPRFEVEREYAVRLMGELTDEIRAKLLDGIEIEGEKCKFDLIEDRGGSEEGSNHWYHVVLREGKNREVRKMFEAVGLMVSRLMRVRFGPVTLPTFLKRGMMKEMEEAETLQLLDFCGLKMEAPQTTAPAATAEAAEEDEDAQPPGISHTQSTILGNILQQPGGGGGGRHRDRGQRPQGQGGQGQSHGQGQGQKFGKQGKHRKHRKGGQGAQGQGQQPGQGGPQKPWQGGQGNNKKHGGGRNKQRQRPRGDEQPHFPEPAPVVHRSDEQPRFYVDQDRPPRDEQPRPNPQGNRPQGGRPPRGDQQPRFKQQAKRPPRGDEQPRFDDNEKKVERGDEQPLTNENRRVW